MNYRKKRQQQNLKKEKKQIHNDFLNDPSNSKCPFCGQSKKGCSYVNSLSRAWARSICHKKLTT